MSIPRSPRFDAAAGFTRPLYGGAGTALVVAAVTFGIQQLLGDDTLTPLAIYTLLVAVVLYAAARTAWLRQDVRDAQAQDVGRTSTAADRPPSPEARPEAPGEASGSERPDDAVPEPLAPRAQASLERFGREGIAIAFSAGGAVGLGASVLVFRGGLGVAQGGSLTVLIGLGLAALAFLLQVASRGTRAIPPPRLPESAGLGEWLRGAQWMAFLTGLGLLGRSVPMIPLDWSRWLAVPLLAVSALCALELWVRGVRQGVRRRAPWHESEVPLRLFVLSALFHGRSPLHGVLELAERRLGLSLQSTWTLGVIRRSLSPLVAGLGVLLWASTTLVVVRPAEQGLRFRFGRLVSAVPVEPGLRLKRPWPFEVVERYPVRRVQTLGLGYGAPANEPLLWGRRHASEEYQLLLGDGRELVSVDAIVTYRIRDVVAFALAYQNPRDALEALAYRLLMAATVATSLDRLLTADRESVARRFVSDLQRVCDAERLGLAILHVGFVSLHPPVGIAEAYEQVVSAEIERTTRAARARADREHTLPTAQAEASREIQDAEGEAARRLADARGAAAGFLAALRAHQASPDLFRLRRRLEAIEEALTDRRLFVIDQRLRPGTGDLWIDLRPAPGAESPNPEKRQ